MKQQKFAQVKWLGFAHVKSLDFDQVKISRAYVVVYAAEGESFSTI